MRFRRPFSQELHVSGQDDPEAAVPRVRSHLPPALRFRHAAAGGSPPQHLLQALYLLCAGELRNGGRLPASGLSCSPLAFKGSWILSASSLFEDLQLGRALEDRLSSCPLYRANCAAAALWVCGVGFGFFCRKCGTVGFQCLNVPLRF